MARRRARVVTRLLSHSRSSWTFVCATKGAFVPRAAFSLDPIQQLARPLAGVTRAPTPFARLFAKRANVVGRNGVVDSCPSLPCKGL